MPAEKGNKMKSGSLFTGIAGFDLGFEQAGIETVWQAEQDKHCLELLETKFPKAKRYTDVREIDATAARVDIITGGFPCQDVSLAGKRAGLAGERSGLWFEFARIIDELEPGWVVIENVPGLLSSNKGRDFAVIVQWLAERGYGVAWRVLDAQYFGVAQRRRRVFIVGSFGNGRAAEVLFEPESCFGNTPKKARKKDTSVVFQTANTSQNGSGYSEDLAYTLDGANSQAVSGTLQANYGTKWGLGNQECGTGQFFAWDGLLRRYTPTECERLQGFPDRWTDGFSDSTRYKMLGNAVAVPVARWIAERMNHDNV